jgi:hypothetical protein
MALFGIRPIQNWTFKAGVLFRVGHLKREFYLEWGEYILINDWLSIPKRNRKPIPLTYAPIVRINPAFCYSLQP